MYQAFIANWTPSILLEINPLVVNGAGEVIALDAKMNFDDNALYRHPGVASLRDEAEEDPVAKELEAGKHELQLRGNSTAISAALVNGAGLAMATMDIIKLWRRGAGELADVGGGCCASAGDDRVQADPIRPACRRRSGQHLRRHHEARRVRAKASSRPCPRYRCMCRWWSGWKAPQYRARQENAVRIQASTPSCPPTTWPTPPSKIVRGSRRRRPHKWPS